MAVLLIACGVGLTESAGWADEEDGKLVCLLRPRAEGPNEEAKLSLDLAVQAALRQHKLLPTSARERDVQLDNEGLSLCETESCYDRIGRQLRVQAIVHYSVWSGAEKKTTTLPDERTDWRLGVRYFNATVGSTTAQNEGLCARCTLSEATAKLATLLDAAIAADAGHAQGELEVTSVPSGVPVLLDNTESGVTPYKRPALVGPHLLALRFGGFRTHRESVEVQPGKLVQRQIVLEPGEESAASTAAWTPPHTQPASSPHPVAWPRTSTRPAWRMVLGGTLMGLGLAGIASGAYAFVLDGQCFQAGALPTWVCVQGYTPGVSLTVPGVVLVLAGGVLIAAPARSR